MDQRTDAKAAWIFGEGADGRFTWHRVAYGITPSRYPVDGLVHMTSCGRRIGGRGAAAPDARPLCKACEA